MAEQQIEQESRAVTWKPRDTLVPTTSLV